MVSITRRASRCRNGEKHFFLKPAFFSDLKRHAPLSDIARLTTRPALLIQGTEDTKVLPHQTQALYEAAGKPKALQHVEGAPHAFTFHEEKLFDITLRHLAAWSERFQKTESEEGSTSFPPVSPLAGERVVRG